MHRWPQYSLPQQTKTTNPACMIHAAGFGWKALAATYSRASYTGTTIGNAVFDVRVRDGIGSGHCFMATNKNVSHGQRTLPHSHSSNLRLVCSLKTTHRTESLGTTVETESFKITLALPSSFLIGNGKKGKVIKPHERLVRVGSKPHGLYTSRLSTG